MPNDANIPVLDRALARDAVAAGVAQYFADRRARVDSFVDRHFSLRGTLRLHLAALGWDILKAPLNLSLAAPQVVLRLSAASARRAGAARLGRALDRTLLLDTAVARRITWLINTELLELPFAQGGEVATRDALAEAILGTEAVSAAMALALRAIGRHSDDAAFRDRLLHAMAEYTVSHAAAAEITTGLMSLGAGAVTLNKLTPGAATLGPALAGIMAHEAAVASFPLGGVWYGVFPAAPTAGLIAGTTGGLMLAAACFAAFAGVVADPVQRALGLHRARLLKMIAALERQMDDAGAKGFTVHDHYVARLLDLFDIIGAAVRLTGAA